MKKYIVTEVKAAFDGIANLPQKENLSLEDIQQSLPNILAGTSYEADTYEVIFHGYFKTKAVVFVNSYEDKKLSFSPIAAYSFFGLFEINGERVLVSFRDPRTPVKAKIFVVRLESIDDRVTRMQNMFEKHELQKKQQRNNGQTQYSFCIKLYSAENSSAERPGSSFF